jgi:hypothetical protein
MKAKQLQMREGSFCSYPTFVLVLQTIILRQIKISFSSYVVESYLAAVYKNGENNKPV